MTAILDPPFWILRLWLWFVISDLKKPKITVPKRIREKLSKFHQINHVLHCHILIVVENSCIIFQKNKKCHTIWTTCIHFDKNYNHQRGVTLLLYQVWIPSFLYKVKLLLYFYTKIEFLEASTYARTYVRKIFLYHYSRSFRLFRIPWHQKLEKNTKTKLPLYEEAKGKKTFLSVPLA